MRRQFIGTVAVLVGLALVSGCNSGGRISEGEKTIESLADVRKSIGEAKLDVDEAVAAMDKLASGQEMQKSHKAFTKEVDDLEKAGESARGRATKMRERADEYVAKWQKEMETVQNPEVKASLADRRAAVQKNFDAVKAASAGVRDAYQPFMQNLRDINKALAIDLSPAALTGIKPVMDKTRTDATTLKQKLDALDKELAAIQTGMGATPKG
jgi:hypothetical protein